MAEDKGLCTYEKHHKQKIILFLSSMRSYADSLKKNNFKLEFESLANEKCAEGIDKRQSGKYLILHLCHYFDPNKSITSLTVCRDTYGLHTSKK